MLKMTWYCSDCGAEGDVSQDEMVDLMGCCPKCMHHKGNVEYSCNMSLEQFLDELYNMSEKDMAKYHFAISECAYDLKQNL